MEGGDTEPGNSTPALPLPAPEQLAEGLGFVWGQEAGCSLESLDSLTHSDPSWEGAGEEEGGREGRDRLWR